MKKKALQLRAQIHCTPRDGARQRAIEPQELLLMMETLSRWVNYDHRHKTFLTYEVIKIAARVLQLIAVKTHWKHHPAWPEAAFFMGLDLKSFTVVDPIKFKWFWWQLGQNGKFTVKLQKQLLASGKEPPEIEPLIITKPYWTPKVKTEKLHAEAVKEYQNNSMHERIIDHFFV